MSQTMEDLRAVHDRLNKLPERRAELIQQARAEGETWRAIALLLGMTENGVKKAAQPKGKK